jgi:CHAT domain-containing protein
MRILGWAGKDAQKRVGAGKMDKRLSWLYMVRGYRRTGLGRIGLLIVGLSLMFRAGAQVPAETGSSREERMIQAAELYAADDRAAAEEVYRSVIRDSEQRDSLLALAYHRIGAMAGNEYKDSVAAVHHRIALRIRDSLFRGPHNERAHSRVNLGLALKYMNRPDTALLLFREANDMYGRIAKPDSVNWITSLSEISSIAIGKQDFTLASNVSYRATALHAQTEGVDPFNSVVVHLNAAETSLRLNQIPEALAYARQAHAYAEALNIPFITATTHNLLAIVQREAGLIELGRENLEKGIRMAREAEGEEEIRGLLHLNLAEYHAGKDDFVEALHHDSQSRTLLESIGLSSVYCASDKVPDQLLRAGRTERAMAMVNDKLSCLTGVDEGPALATYLDTVATGIIPLIDLISLRARIYRSRGELDQAILNYRAVLRLQDRLREGVHSAESQLYLSQNLRPFFDQAIALYYRRYEEREKEEDLWAAFELSERARAYNLLSALQRSTEVPSEQDRRLREREAELDRAVSLGDSSKRAELAAVRLQRDRLNYTNEGNKEAVPIHFDREAVIAYLRDANNDLLEYHLGDSLGLVFYLTAKGKLNVYRISGVEELPSLIKAWRDAIRDGSYRRKSLRNRSEQDSLDRAFATLGTTLYERLIPFDLRESLHLRPRLSVVPDGALHYLPFAALPLDSESVPIDYGNTAYLGGATHLRYAYSSRYLLQVDSAFGKTFAYTLLAFAPSFEGRRKTNGTRAARNILRSGEALTPLTYNREEVNQITGLIENTRVFTDAEADRAHFLETIGQGRILHLSSHGSVDPSDPNLSFIAFSQSGDSLNRDELIYFNDLYGLPLNNELTVLSACETSLGKLAAGETTMSLASAFAAAGARSTLTTLWQVDDEATKEAIVSFYGYLVNGDGRVEALSKAQEELRNSEYAHPFYWAGLSLHGAAGPIDLGSVLPAYIPGWTWGFVGVGIVIALGYFFNTVRGAMDYVAD